MTASNNLTSLANAKNWCGVTTANDDALLTRLIGAASRYILSYIERPSLFQAQYADVYDGVGQRWQMLKNWPVLSVKSLLIGTQLIPVSPGFGQCGYVLDQWNGVPPGSVQRLSLYGYCFPRDAQAAIAVIYNAGFVVQNEAQTVPGTPFQVTVNAPYGNWAVDQGVTYANGTPLTAILSGIPATGQYVAPTATNAFYQFAAGDANAAVLISYSYIPADIEQACCEMISERYSYKDRVGVVSKSLGGQETVSFSQKGMSDYVTSLLLPYKSFVLV